MSEAQAQPNLITAEDALDAYLADLDQLVAEGIRSPRTRRDNERLLERAFDIQFIANARRQTLRHVPVNEITPAMIRGLLMTYASSTTRYGTRPAPLSVRNLRNALGSLLGPVFDTIDGTEAPTKAINLRAVHKRDRTAPLRESRYLPESQYEQFLARITDTWRPMMSLILHTGPRSAEARGLRISDLDLDSDTPGLRINGQADEHGGYTTRVKKRASRRFVPLEPVMVEMLREQIAPLDPSGFVFPTASGRTQTGSNAWRAVQRAAGDGLPTLSVHDLRHSAAIRWIMRGVPLNAVSKALGHASTDITARIYLSASLTDEALHGAITNPRGVEFRINDEDDDEE